MKWKIKRTEDNYEEVNNYFNCKGTTNAEYSCGSGYCYSIPVNNGGQHVYSDTDSCILYDPNDFTEITIEEFRNIINGTPILKEVIYEIY